MNKIQLRGHCQCCGRQQAVPTAHMSKHGYTVKEGWFQGVCHGDRYAPIEVSRAHADAICKQVRSDVADLKVQLQALKDGKSHPAQVACGSERNPSTGKFEPIMKPYAEAEPWHQREGVNTAIWRVEGRILAGNNFADGLQRIADEYHGKPLQEVKKEDGPRPVLAGERRMLEGGKVAVSRGVFRGMVIYDYTNSAGKVFKSKMATRSWRLLPEPQIE